MPTSCCAIGCTNHAYKKDCIDRQVSFHKFPKDPVLKKAWLFEMRRQSFKPSFTTKICSDHFEQDCITYQKTTNRRCLVKDALPTIFSFSKKGGNQRKLQNSTPETASVPKRDANGKLLFVGHLPGREPRGQAQRKTFKDFIMSKGASKAQSKLTETNEKLAVLHKRRFRLKTNAKSKPCDLLESSSLLYLPYESHFVNYKGRSAKQRSLKANLSSEDPLVDSSVDDPPVAENSSSDDESSNHSEYLSSEESWRGSSSNYDESSSGSLHQPHEENLSSDESSVDSPSQKNVSLKKKEPPGENLSSNESSVDSPSYKNVSFKEKESETTSALQGESNLSSDENSNNLVNFISKLSSPIASISSPIESENVTESADLQKLLTPLDNKSCDKKSLKLLKKSAGSSSNNKLFEFKHRIQPNSIEKKDSSIAKLLKSGPAYECYLEELASIKNVESSDALFSNSFRWELANFKGKWGERLARARRQKLKLKKRIISLQRNTLYWKRKNANLKRLLDQQEDEEQDV